MESIIQIKLSKNRLIKDLILIILLKFVPSKEIKIKEYKLSEKVLTLCSKKTPKCTHSKFDLVITILIKVPV